MRQMILVLLLYTATAHTYAAGVEGVSVRFSVSPERVLSPLPVTFRFAVTNATSRPFTVPTQLVLGVTAPDGDSYLVLPGATLEALDERWVQRPLIVDPHSTAHFELPAHISMRMPLWDARLTFPGVHKLRVLVLVDADPSVIEDARTLNNAQGRLSTPFLLSNEVSVTVEIPAGQDMVVCELARKELMRLGRAPRAYCPISEINFEHDLIRAIWFQHRNSTYAPFFATRVRVGDADREIQIVRDAIAADPDSLSSEWNRLYLAGLEENRSADLHGSAASDEYASQASATYRWIIARSKVPAVRRQAEERFERFSAVLDGRREPQ